MLGYFVASRVIFFTEKQNHVKYYNAIYIKWRRFVVQNFGYQIIPISWKLCSHGSILIALFKISSLKHIAGNILKYIVTYIFCDL